MQGPYPVQMILGKPSKKDGNKIFLLSWISNHYNTIFFLLIIALIEHNLLFA